ncbi:MAG: hypothetical protein ACJ789_03050 [Thermomicrobiales bacterium]
MRHNPGFYRRFAVLALHKEAVRGGLCVILLLALVLIGLPFSLVLVVPLLTYSGLWLVTSFLSKTSDNKPESPRSADEAFAKSLSFQRRLRVSASRAEYRQVSDQLQQISGWVDKILQTVVEDGKYQASLTLIGLTETTDDLLTAYLKVVRRGLDESDVRERVRENLATLETAYQRFWMQLNRDAVVNLKALNEAIELNLRDLGAARLLGGIA